MLDLSEVTVLRDLLALGEIAATSGRRLVLHPTFGERFARLPFDVAAVNDDRALIRNALSDEALVRVVIETQVPSGSAAAQRWPRTFVGPQAVGRAFAVVTRGVNQPLRIRLEGDAAP